MRAVKKKEQKNGSISFRGGKGEIQLKDGPHDFDISFVISRMRAGARKSRSGFYKKKILSYCTEIEEQGTRIIPSVKNRLETLKCGTDVNRQFFNGMIGWLNTISMFSKMRSGRKVSATKNYFNNFDRINWGI